MASQPSANVPARQQPITPDEHVDLLRALAAQVIYGRQCELDPARAGAALASFPEDTFWPQYMGPALDFMEEFLIQATQPSRGISSTK